jgi:23S rRNA (cytidine1920-2'-O)/16S rRNA (cytidine1409-2'-O)-methyltransferase
VPRKRADVLLVERGLFESRAKARAAIEAGGVSADGRVLAKASEAVEQSAEIVAVAAHPYVGRGALKLVHALDLWPVAAAGRIVLDVGRGQLHPKLAADPRVVSLEGVDARALTGELIPEPPQLVVTDVSFISLEKALPAALALAAPGADLVALVKPQFEVGPERVGRGGLVKDAAARQAALEAVAAFVAASGWPVQATADSPIEGGDGAREFLLWAKKG